MPTSNNKPWTWKVCHFNFFRGFLPILFDFIPVFLFSKCLVWPQFWFVKMESTLMKNWLQCEGQSSGKNELSQSFCSDVTIHTSCVHDVHIDTLRDCNVVSLHQNSRNCFVVQCKWIFLHFPVSPFAWNVVYWFSQKILLFSDCIV